MVLYFLPALLLILFAIGVLRTLFLRNLPKTKATTASVLPTAEVIRKLQDAITFKTISNNNESDTDWKEFERFESYLATAFPLCEKNLKQTSTSPHNLIYRFEGLDTSLQPGLLTAHQDVVGANPSEWKHPPFAGDFHEGYIWGRGSFDCKLQLIAILESFETLLKQNRKPQRTWYAAFGCDEEVNAGTKGATCIAQQFKQMGLTFSLVLDEGGVVSEQYIQGINNPIAVVGVAEKGYLDVELSCSRSAGHSSTPEFPTALGKISQAVTKIENHRHPKNITKPVEQMLLNIGKEAPFWHSFLFLNLWLTKPLLVAVFSKSPTLNAVLRTTSVPTMVQASDKSNVIAQQASCTVNSRLLQGDDEKSVVKWLRHTIQDKEVAIQVKKYSQPSKESPTTGKAFESLRATIKEVFPEAIVTSYLMLGATDARKYEGLSEYIYRFTPAQMDKTEIQRMHGPDERISSENLQKSICFFLSLLNRW